MEAPLFAGTPGQAATLSRGGKWKKVELEIGNKMNSNSLLGKRWTNFDLLSRIGKF